ncbi:MAG TPA: daunorubicin resistance protein DrrC [Clostridiales bacterium]|nr:MAG: daunorubicin resistance protein DrrC [Clostridiales bacterium GWD2_32_19]HCC07257.1 daunorubicin resistance protein DrrC [Clostridiales bacterium]
MYIKIKGAREHNLKNISINIPRNQFVVITGVSGSGKSTLAFDTIFLEAQRDYLESMSAYARRIMPKLGQSKVDSIEGLSPCIVINQKQLARNPRSTVGTVTEVYTFLRLLYSRMGTPILNSEEFSFNTPMGACKNCGGLGVELKSDLDKLIDFERSLNDGAILHKTWCIGSRYWNIINATGYFDMNKRVKDYSAEEVDLLLYSDTIQYQNEQPGYVQSFSYEGVVSRLLKRQSDSRGLESNSYDRDFFSMATCSSCNGTRLNDKARSIKINDIGIVDLLTMEIRDLKEFLKCFSGEVAESIIPYINKILGYMCDVGIGYLSLSRSVATLSNGESQKVKLARQLGSSLTELIYIIDEPTAGLHARDAEHVTEILRKLVKKPNTVIVVEHDRDVMLNADYIIDIGPGAGTYGGEIVAEGTVEEIKNSGSLTGDFISGKKKIKKRNDKRITETYIEIKNATNNNLKNIDVKIPKGVLTCLTGVSGSGKSSLIEVFLKENPNSIVIDQSPIGASPRSNPATYTGAFDIIRKVFSKATGIDASFFTFNSKGACEECGGLGYKTMDMHFLGDIRGECEICKGKRYKEEVLNYLYNGKNISEVLDLTISDAIDFFDNKQIKEKIKMLAEVGLGYLKLGQSLDTLSGGEAQRVKLASQLSINGNIYILDEPTRGLHFVDIEKLLDILNKLVDYGNTVLVVEHNMDVIKNADWIIDMGPEGGKNGGKIIAEGTPEDVAKVEDSATGKYLAKELTR